MSRTRAGESPATIHQEKPNEDLRPGGRGQETQPSEGHSEREGHENVWRGSEAWDEKGKGIENWASHEKMPSCPVWVDTILYPSCSTKSAGDVALSAEASAVSGTKVESIVIPDGCQMLNMSSRIPKKTVPGSPRSSLDEWCTYYSSPIWMLILDRDDMGAYLRNRQHMSRSNELPSRLAEVLSRTGGGMVNASFHWLWPPVWWYWSKPWF